MSNNHFMAGKLWSCTDVMGELVMKVELMVTKNMNSVQDVKLET